MESIYNEEGRAYNTSTTATPAWRYEYNLKDHLGNTRVTFADLNNNGAIDGTSEILQENHYYAFGMACEGSWLGNNNAAKNKYLYNGKELNEDFGLNLSDYGARWYDAAVGRWWSVDPLAEKRDRINPYNYTSNNPVKLIDPNGMLDGLGDAGQSQYDQSKKEREEKSQKTRAEAKSKDGKSKKVPIDLLVF